MLGCTEAVHVSGHTQCDRRPSRHRVANSSTSISQDIQEGEDRSDGDFCVGIFVSFYSPSLFFFCSRVR